MQLRLNDIMIPIRRRKEIANVGMRVIMRICSAMKAADNAKDYQKEGPTHSRIGFFEFSGVVLSTPLAPTFLFLFFCLF